MQRLFRNLLYVPKAVTRAAIAGVYSKLTYDVHDGLLTDY